MLSPVRTRTMLTSLHCFKLVLWGNGENGFGNEGVISTQQWADRKSVVDRMLAVLPPSRMVSLRTPNFAMHMYGSTPVSAATAFDQSSISRLGQHNDAFVADATDSGTYLNPLTEFLGYVHSLLLLPWVARLITITPLELTAPTRSSI